MSDKTQSDKNNEIRDLRERQSQLTTAIELAIAVSETRELSRGRGEHALETLNAMGRSADYYADKLDTEFGWQARLRAMATGGTWHTYTPKSSRPIGPGLAMALASRIGACAHGSAAPEPSIERPEGHEVTRLSERVLRLEALLLDPAELAKEPAEALEQLRQMPGGAPLQLGRLANLEEAVEQTAALGDGLARIATALERAAGVQEQHIAGERLTWYPEPCKHCGCQLVRVAAAGDLRQLKGCPGCGTEIDGGAGRIDTAKRPPPWLGIASPPFFSPVDEPPPGAFSNQPGPPPKVDDLFPSPGEPDICLERPPLPDGIDYPIRVAATSFERGPISVSLSVAAVETFESGKAPVDARMLWGCRCGERYELTATAATSAHGWQSQPLEPNGTERQLADDLAAVPTPPPGAAGSCPAWVADLLRGIVATERGSDWHTAEPDVWAGLQRIGAAAANLGRLELATVSVDVAADLVRTALLSQGLEVPPDGVVTQELERARGRS